MEAYITELPDNNNTSPIGYIHEGESYHLFRNEDPNDLFDNLASPIHLVVSVERELKKGDLYITSEGEVKTYDGEYRDSTWRQVIGSTNKEHGVPGLERDFLVKFCQQDGMKKAWFRAVRRIATADSVIEQIILSHYDTAEGEVMGAIKNISNE